jgi:integrase
VPRWSKEPRDRVRVGRGILRLHVLSRVWYFQYRDAAGPWKSTSTGHRDRKGATEWALAKGVELTRLEHGLIRPDERVSNDLITAAAGEWLGYIAGQRKAGTVRTYTSCVNNLKRYLQARPRVQRLEQFDKAEVLRYRDWLLVQRRRRPNTKKTADNNLVVLRAFFSYCVGLRKLRANPISERNSGVQLFFDEVRPPLPTYTCAEYRAILGAASPDLANVCRVLAASGLRIDELLHVRTDDVDFGAGWLHVRAKTLEDGRIWSPKDRTDRKVPLNNDLRAALADLMGDRSSERWSPPAGALSEPAASAPGATVSAPPPRPTFLVPGVAGPRRSQNLARQLLKQLKKLATSTGIAASKLTLHNFRRYFVSQCADCGIDILCVMEWVGHGDWGMVRRYYRLRDDHAQSAAEQFDTGAAASDRVDGAPPPRRHKSRRQAPVPPQGASPPTAADAGAPTPLNALGAPFGEHVGKRPRPRRGYSRRGPS